MNKKVKFIIMLLVVAFAGNYFLPFGVTVRAYNDEPQEEKAYENYSMTELEEYYKQKALEEVELEKKALEIEEELKAYLVETDYYYTFDIPDDANIDIDEETLMAMVEGLNSVNEGLANGDFFIHDDEIYISGYDEEYVIHGGKNGFKIAYTKVLFVKVPCGFDFYLNSTFSTILGFLLVVIATYNMAKFINNFKLSLSDARALLEKVDTTFMPIITTFKYGYDAIMSMVGISTGGIVAVAEAVLKIFIKVVLNTFLISAAVKYIQNGDRIIGLIGNNKGSKTTFNVAKMNFSISAQ